jgi:hypothetical protein
MVDSGFIDNTSYDTRYGYKETDVGSNQGRIWPDDNASGISAIEVRDTRRNPNEEVSEVIFGWAIVGLERNQNIRT